MAPGITSTPPTNATIGQPYSYQVTATGNPTPAFSLTTAPTGMTIDSSTGLISWTPTTSGSYPVEVTATNSAGTDTQSFTIDVNAPVNQPPTAAFTFDCVGLECTFDASGSSDPDGSIVSYDWAFGDTTTGAGVSPSHTYGTDDTYTVSLTVTDNDGATNTALQPITVSAGLVGNIPATGSNSSTNGSQTVTWTSAFTNDNYTTGDTVRVLAEWTMSCGATEFNPRNLALGVEPRGSGFTPGGVTGTAPRILSSTDNSVLFEFEFTQLKQQSTDMKGNAQFWIYVGIDQNCDGAVDSNRTGVKAQARLGVNVHVIKPGIPAAPTITSAPVTTAATGESYSYQVLAEGNPEPRYRLVSGPWGMSIDQQTGMIEWMPGAPGTYDVRVRAVNGISPNAIQNFQITIAPPPVATLTIIKVANPAAPWLDWDFAGNGGIGTFTLDNDSTSATPDRMSFEVAPGSYTITETNKPGNWDVIISCTGTTPTINGTAMSVDLAAGDEVECTFLNQRKPQIRITKYADVNGNGTQDSGEPVLEGWQMFLYVNNLNGAWVPIQTREVRTSTNGIANYTSLQPGVDHLVCEEDRAGWLPTTPGVTTFDGKFCQEMKNLVYGEVRDVSFGNYEQPAPQILYRARQVGSRVWIERNIVEAGLGDFDGDPVDGWALVGRTNGAGDNGELRGFFVDAGVPYAIVFNRSNNKGNRCILLTPKSLAVVKKGQTRFMNNMNDNYTPCPAISFTQLPAGVWD